MHRYQAMNVQRAHKARRSVGFTLIELMVAMLLGLIVIAGVASVFLANLQSYHSNTALSEVQTNARIAYALMARDIRQAGLTGCDSTNKRIANVLKSGPYGSGTHYWWSQWANAVRGYDDATTDPALSSFAGDGAPMSQTDSVQLIGAVGTGLAVVQHNPTSANFKLNIASDDIAAGDVIMVCDPDHASIVQVTNYNSATKTLVHQTGNTVQPGNCSKGLGFPTNCSSVNGNAYTFGKNSRISRLAAVDWYVGSSQAANGRSLYRVQVQPNAAGTMVASPVEMVRDVIDMKVTYHVRGDNNYVTAGTVTAANNWGLVDAVRVELVMLSSEDRVGTDGNPLRRTFTTTTTIRNRVP